MSNIRDWSPSFGLGEVFKRNFLLTNSSKPHIRALGLCLIYGEIYGRLEAGETVPMCGYEPIWGKWAWGCGGKGIENSNSQTCCTKFRSIWKQMWHMWATTNDKLVGINKCYWFIHDANITYLKNGHGMRKIIIIALVFSDGCHAPMEFQLVPMDSEIDSIIAPWSSQWQPHMCGKIRASPVTFFPHGKLWPDALFVCFAYSLNVYHCMAYACVDFDQSAFGPFGRDSSMHNKIID